MKLSRAGDYGMRTVLALAERPPSAIVSVRELSLEQGVPAPFLAKVVARLTEAGIKESYLTKVKAGQATKVRLDMN